MRIEKLLPPPQPGKPWSVALEGGEVLRVSESVVASFALYGGMELEAETLTALQEAAALAAWREKGGAAAHRPDALLRPAGGKAHRQRGHGGAGAQVVAWAQDIACWTTARTPRPWPGITPPRATAPIKSKTNSTAAKSPERIGRRPWAAVEPPETWISDFLSRKIQDPEDPAQIKKASDALVRRGFSWHTVSQAVTRFLNGTDPW